MSVLFSWVNRQNKNSANQPAHAMAGNVSICIQAFHSVADELVVPQKMKCITESQIDEWLGQRSIHKDPYHGNASPTLYLQFYAPTNHGRIDAFVRYYYNFIVPEVDSLIQMTDWGTYEQSEMIAIEGIRSNCGEDRMLIDAPGHILQFGEKEIGISLFSLSASFAWSSYLYSPRDHSTLFNWEGEIFDFWTDSVHALSMIRIMLNQFDLTLTHK